MSISKREYTNAAGRVYKTRYRVRWAQRNPVTNKREYRSREFRTQAEARDYDAEVRLQQSQKKEGRRIGRVAATVTLQDLWDDFVATKSKHGELEPSTLKVYDGVWNNHMAGVVGSLALADCDGTTAARDRLVGAFKQRGTVGAATKRKAFDALSSLLNYAQDYGMIVAHNSRPRRGSVNLRGTRRKARMISLYDIEYMRRWICQRGRGSSIGYTADHLNRRDVLFLTLMGYAGLRPAEVMGLQVADIDLHDDPAKVVIRIRRQVADGVEKDVKNFRAFDHAAIRDLSDLPRPLVDDLRSWLDATKFVSDSDFLFHQGDGSPWTKTNYRKWRYRVFERALRSVTEDGTTSVTGAVPYDLRTSLCVTYPLVGVDALTAARRSGHTTAVAYEFYVTASHNPDALGLENVATWQDWCNMADDLRRAEDISTLVNSA